MTIQKQNAINAEYQKLQSRCSMVPVTVTVSPGIVARVVHYLDAHPGESWDSVAEAALEKFLSTTA